MPAINTKNKITSLKDNIRKYSKVIVAFSGGVDSSFLLAVSAEVLGINNITAVTAFSETYTESELYSAKELAKKIGVQHIIIETDELDDRIFASNTADRCYYCKKNFYSKLIAFSRKTDIPAVFDGSNADDASDYRPGRTAAKEFGIISPLMEEGLSKEDVRSYSKAMNLPTWNKPANPCLASRIPYGIHITKEKLEAVSKAETFIRNKGFNIVRVRHHNLTARIEIPAQDLSRFMQNNIREEVNVYIKSLGFTWVALDIEGYRTGSLNSALDRKI